jgi:AraC-like DNA-binding protein
MSLVTVLTRDPAVRAAVRAPLGPAHHVASTRSWCRFLWLVRERPVTVAVLDSPALSRGQTAADAIPELQRRFPSLALVLAYREEFTDPYALFRLGRANVGGLSLIRLDGLAHGLRGAIARAAGHCTEAHLTRAIGTRLSTRDTAVIRLALHGVQLGWGADDLAAAAGFTRAHLSVRLKAHGLPSAGHLLLWAKLLHAGRWLTDPARSAESVSRQLDYSSGAAFRRALANYLEMTPTEVIEGGGLSLVLSRFLDVCGVRDSVWFDRSVA